MQTHSITVPFVPPSGNRKYPPPAERFELMVDRNGPVVVRELGPCWIWKGRRNHNGYGQIKYPGGTLAHRLSWVLRFGRIPAGARVLHWCDNPPCINPGHLHLGTQLQNVHESMERGRRHVCRREEHGRAKLTEVEVAEIRAAYSPSAAPSRFLARKYGVTKTTILRIVKGVLWPQVTA